MPEGTLCNKNPIETDDTLKTLLSDTGGKQYYKEMKSLDVDSRLLWETIEKTCKSRIRTWLKICAHCGICADSCELIIRIPGRCLPIKYNPPWVRSSAEKEG